MTSNIIPINLILLGSFTNPGNNQTWNLEMLEVINNLILLHSILVWVVKLELVHSVWTMLYTASSKNAMSIGACDYWK